MIKAERYLLECSKKKKGFALFNQIKVCVLIFSMWVCGCVCVGGGGGGSQQRYVALAQHGPSE